MLVLAAAIAVVAGVAVWRLAGVAQVFEAVDQTQTVETTGVLVWLDTDVSFDEVQVVDAELRRHPQVVSARYIDQDETYRVFEAYFGDEPEVLEMVGPEDLPTSFEAVVTGDAAAVAEELAAIPGVQGVEVEDMAPDAVGDGQAETDLAGSFLTKTQTQVGGESNQIAVWTGSRVLSVRTENGGGEVVGEQWNPATGTAQRIAGSGLAWRVNTAWAWTGTELLMVGGSNGPGIDRPAVAYDPALDRWRDLTPPPGQVDAWDNAFVGPAIWTGQEMVVPGQGAAYDPATDSWREIAQWPLTERNLFMVAAVGSPTDPAIDAVVVLGGCDRPQCEDANSFLVGGGAVYDPATDRWTVLPEPPVAPYVHGVLLSVDDTSVLLVSTEPGGGGEPQAALLSRNGSDGWSWQQLPEPPLSRGRGTAAVAVGGDVVIWGSNSAARLIGGLSTWDALPPVQPEFWRRRHTMVEVPGLDGPTIYITGTPDASSPLVMDIDASLQPSD